MITLIALSRLTAMEGKPRNQKKGTKMNPLTHFKKTRILPLFIAPALIALAAFTAVPARATPGCGFAGTEPVSARAGRLLPVWLAQFDV